MHSNVHYNVNIKNKSIFVILSFSILALIMTAYANTIQSVLITTFAQENQTGTLNEAEVNADIEQENKCKKDTECENENELNNQLSITNITQTQKQTGETQATLNVIKNLTCEVDGVDTEFCEDIGPENAQITVTGNNPSPSQFPGSSQGTLVTLGPGDYTVSEVVAVLDGPYDVSLGATFSGDCTQDGIVNGKGTISDGELQTCTIDNTVTLID